MTQQSALQARLSALQSDPVFSDGQKRVIRAGRPGGGADAILRELNETVLPRRLAFEAESGRKMVLDVAARRVLRIAELDKTKGNKAAMKLVGTAIADEDQNIAVTDAVRDFGADETALMVRSLASTDTNEAVNIGLPIGRMAEFLNIDLNASATPVASSRLERFLAAISEINRSHVLLQDGECVDRSGDDEFRGAMCSYLSTYSSELFAQLSLLSDNASQCCMVLAARFGEDLGVVAARDEAQTILAICELGTEIDISAVWNASRI